MKCLHLVLQKLIVLAFAFPAWTGAEEASQWNRAAFEHEVLLMTLTEGDFGAGSVEMLEEEEKRKLTGDEKSIFVGLDDGKWKVFEDEYIRFEMPDHPLLKVEVVKPETQNRIRIVGGAVGTTGNRFQQAYRMTVNELPFGVILLNEAEWFDDGICLCGPIVHKTCVLKNGTLLEFSLLPGGQVKKVQALGAKHRAVLFEWTHSALKAERYQRIASSIRLKQTSDRKIDEWMTLERKHRGDEGHLGLGWLRRGDPEVRVRALLGNPARKEADKWVFEKERWEEDGSGRLVSLSVDIVDGKFTGLPPRMWVSRDLPPKQGSTAWAERVVENLPELKESRAKLPEAARSIYDEFKKQAPKSSAWNKWCQIAHELTEKGYWDESVQPVASSRFLEIEIEQHFSAWLLDDYPTQLNEELFQKRARLVLDDCRSNLKQPKTDPHEIWNLFSFMKMKEKASLDLLREAAGHPHDTVRGSAYGQADALPRDEARTIAKKAILSETDNHCQSMALSLIRDVGTQEDLKWLQSVKENFKTKELTEDWSEAVHALQTSKSNK
jgi:hypothetical protein